MHICLSTLMAFFGPVTKKVGFTQTTCNIAAMRKPQPDSKVLVALMKTLFLLAKANPVKLRATEVNVLFEAHHNIIRINCIVDNFLCLKSYAS